MTCACAADADKDAQMQAHLQRAAEELVLLMVQKVRLQLPDELSD